jgi:hypothetical protein
VHYCFQLLVLAGVVPFGVFLLASTALTLASLAVTFVVHIGASVAMAMLHKSLLMVDESARRDQARLLVVDRATGRWFHHHVSDLPGLLRAGDQLVLNDTRVLPARLKGHRAQTGGRWEGLFLGETTAGHWRLMGRTRGRLQPGECLKLEPWPDSPLADAAGPALSELRLRLVAEEPGGFWLATPEPARPALAALTDYGTMPLPPYMERETPGATDFERYQTVYARVPGSVAAPTAGLHFTPELLARCQQAGIRQSFVTLHVGVGRFGPSQSSDWKSTTCTQSGANSPGTPPPLCRRLAPPGDALSPWAPPRSERSSRPRGSTRRVGGARRGCSFARPMPSGTWMPC